MKFLSDEILLSGGRDAIMNAIAIDDGNLAVKEIVAAHNYAVYDIQFSENGKYFATASRDKSIKIWDAKDFQFIQKLDAEKLGGHINSVNKILWSSYNDYIISGSDDRSLMVWEQA